MHRFAFLIHPIEYDDIFRKLKFLQKVPKGVVKSLMTVLPPVKVSKIEGVKSPYGSTEGYFVAVPLVSDQMLSLPEDTVMKKIIKAGKLAEKLGAEIVGLGAMTSVVGDAGITVAKNLNIAVTTGNSYTVATAIEGTIKAAEIMGKDIKDCNAVVIGATGSIGKVCAEILARQVKELALVARNREKLRDFAETLMYKTGISPTITSDVGEALRNADVVITVTSAVDTVIQPEHLKPGAVVCDVARPRDVSKEVVEKRDDVLVIEGGVVEVPGDVDFHFNFGFPPKTSYACMAETMILAMEGRIENFSLGRDMTVEQVEEIAALAKKHGFKLAGFRSFEREVPVEKIKEIKMNARRKKLNISTYNMGNA
ncbi:NAD(P)H-binding protein [Caldanaerobius polysaccharolyticus]|uniref:NAD(P)H-binding protein n=1 Tax=Caldanaerobius polysaccharolyticus TaxID=44256 RepID=UPI00047DB5F0|nr:NAD(P)H-binding protein [Caldanaerobius polysaccharolyticus]